MSFLYPLIAVLLISIISILVAFFFPLSTPHKGLLYMVSFATGALFGDAFIHLLPEAIEEGGDPQRIFLFVLCGIAMMFIVEKIIHWHHCHHTDDHEHTVAPLAKMNLIGDAVHNIIDGLIIAASFLISIPVGIATTIAVMLHEIPQEIGDFCVLLHSGVSKRRALILNGLIALTAIAGVVIGLVLSTYIDGMTGVLIPLAAGSFIYIAGSDLIPELHKEVGLKKSILQLGAFVGGIAVMALLLFLE